jgi:hypothetical protein
VGRVVPVPIGIRLGIRGDVLVAVLTTGQVSLCCGQNSAQMAPGHWPNVAREETLLGFRLDDIFPFEFPGYNCLRWS